MASWALQAGLSQTDYFGLGTGIVGTGYAAAAYNQAAYLASVAMRQCQLYQKKNYDLSWVSVARDDIRDMMNISVTRISNYMMVATLILGVATDALLGVTFPAKCPEFVQTAFWLSMALSILFFAESIMFAVKGQNSAFTNTVRLLTWELRPENPSPYDHDYMKQYSAFESTGLKELLRVPGLAAHFGDDSSNGARGDKDPKGNHKHPTINEDQPSGFIGRLFGGRGSDAGAGSSQDKKRTSASSPFWQVAQGDGQNHKPQEQRPFEEVEPKTTMLLYLARFSHFMQLWQPYETQSKYCIGLGLISLSHGAAYFCLGHFSASGLYMAQCIAWISVFIFVFVTAIVYQQNFRTKHRINRWTVYLLVALGPVCGIIGTVTTSKSVRSWAGAFVFLSHAIHYSVGWTISLCEFKKPWQITKKFTTGPRGQQFPEEWHRVCNESDAEDDALHGARGNSLDSDYESGYEPATPPDDFYGVSRPSAAERRKIVETNNRVTSIVRSSMLFSALVWCVTFCASFFANFESWGLWLTSLTHGQANLLDGDPIAIVAPVPGIQLDSVACANNVMFAANAFQVFSVNISSGAVEAYPCMLQREVNDLAIACDGAACRPLVLLDDYTILDCASGNSTPLLKAMEADRIAQFGSFGEPMLSLNNGTLVQYSFNAQQKGWDPQWVVANVGKKALDIAVAGNRIFVFSLHRAKKGYVYRNGVSIRSPSNFQSLGEWRLSDNSYTTMGGCAMDPRTAYLVQKGSDVRLLRVFLPE